MSGTSVRRLDVERYGVAVTYLLLICDGELEPLSPARSAMSFRILLGLKRAALTLGHADLGARSPFGLR